MVEMNSWLFYRQLKLNLIVDYISDEFCSVVEWLFLMIISDLIVIFPVLKIKIKYFGSLGTKSLKKNGNSLRKSSVDI